MREKIEIKRYQMQNFNDFVEKNQIKLDVKDIFCTSIYLENEPETVNFCFITWTDATPDKSLKKIIRLINLLIKSNHELVFKEEKYGI